MKRLFSAGLLLAMLLSLFSCGGNKGETTPVGTTTAPDPGGETTPAGTTTAPDPEEGEPLLEFDYYGSSIDPYCSLPRESYTGLSFMLDVTDSDVEEGIEEILRQYPIEVTSVDRAVKTGDEVYLYYEGYLDGTAFAGGSNMDDPEPHCLKIGSGSFIPGFEEALVGMIPNQTSKEAPTSIFVTFPDSYHAPELAGKQAEFKIWLVSIIEEYKTPELTEEFVLETLKFETEETDVLAAFRAFVLSELRAERADSIDDIRVALLLDKIQSAVTVIAYPEQSVEFQKKCIRDEIESRYDYYNELAMIYYGRLYYASLDEAACDYFGLDRGSDWSDALTEYARAAVKRLLAVYAVAKNEGLTVSDELFDEMLTGLASASGATKEEVLLAYGESQIYHYAVYGIVFEWLTGQTTFDYGELPIKGNE
jgi:trigger factor